MASRDIDNNSPTLNYSNISSCTVTENPNSTPSTSETTRPESAAQFRSPSHSIISSRFLSTDGTSSASTAHRCGGPSVSPYRAGADISSIDRTVDTLKSGCDISLQNSVASSKSASPLSSVSSSPFKGTAPEYTSPSPSPGPPGANSQIPAFIQYQNQLQQNDLARMRLICSKIDALFKEQMEAIKRPDTETPFKSFDDAFQRLLPFHLLAGPPLEHKKNAPSIVSPLSSRIGSVEKRIECTNDRFMRIFNEKCILECEKALVSRLRIKIQSTRRQPLSSAPLIHPNQPAGQSQLFSRPLNPMQPPFPVNTYKSPSSISPPSSAMNGLLPGHPEQIRYQYLPPVQSTQPSTNAAQSNSHSNIVQQSNSSLQFSNNPSSANSVNNRHVLSSVVQYPSQASGFPNPPSSSIPAYYQQQHPSQNSIYYQHRPVPMQVHHGMPFHAMGTRPPYSNAVPTYFQHPQQPVVYRQGQQIHPQSQMTHIMVPHGAPLQYSNNINGTQLQSSIQYSPSSASPSSHDS